MAKLNLKWQREQLIQGVIQKLQHLHQYADQIKAREQSIQLKEQAERVEELKLRYGKTPNIFGAD